MNIPFPELPTEEAQLNQPPAQGSEAGPSWDYYDKGLTKLISDFDNKEVPKCKVRREVRQNKKNVEEEREKGTILADETIIADHTIDTNIGREAIPYVQYLEQSRRILIFKPKDPTLDTISHPEAIQELELNFTRGMRHLRWKKPWYQVIDGCLLHGANPVEVSFDESKPLHCGIEYVKRDDFIIPLKTKNVQAAEFVARKYELFPGDFEVKSNNLGFDTTVTKDLLQGKEEERTALIEFYRVWFKKDGIVFIAWYAKGKPTWLKKPEPLYMGIFAIPPELAEACGYDPAVIVQHNPAQVPMNIYPVFFLKYDETEVEEVLDCQGRASLDIYTQEAITAMLTGLANGAYRASGIYASATPPAGADADGKASQEIRRGFIHNAGMNFFQPEYPNPILIQACQFLSSRNSQQAGQVDFAAMNRNDSEKTATELNQAKEAAQSLQAASISIFSSIIQEVYTLCYEIARSQALIGQVKLTKTPALLCQEYILSPAGDTEVVERAEKQQRLLDLYPMFGQTPLGPKFQKMIIENAFPAEAEELLSDLTSNENAKTEMIMRMGHILETLPLDELHLSADERAGIQHLLAAAQGMVAQPGNPEASGSPSAAPFPVAPASYAGRAVGQ